MLQRIYIPQVLRYVESFSVVGNFKYKEQYPY